MPARLEAVCQAIYLLFNEGYHGSRSDRAVQGDLCFEALRLALLLSEHPQGDLPRTHALVSLLCFHAARLPGRIDDDGGLIQLEMQDRATWDRKLIGTGFQYLEKAAMGNELSEFHVEACIASLHCAARSYEETDWPAILDLYDMLYRLLPTPVVALNRAVAAGRACGPERGLAELANIRDAAKLGEYPFYPAAQGEFLLLAGRAAEARPYFEQSVALARSSSELRFFERKLAACRASAGD
jgi:RNA polymerase sigma-70 factor (ECF subfamily)